MSSLEDCKAVASKLQPWDSGLEAPSPPYHLNAELDAMDGLRNVVPWVRVLTKAIHDSFISFFIPHGSTSAR